MHLSSMSRWSVLKPPDFAPMNFEIDFKGRAMESDLTELGRRQMGL